MSSSMHGVGFWFLGGEGVRDQSTISLSPRATLFQRRGRIRVSLVDADRLGLLLGLLPFGTLGG